MIGKILQKTFKVNVGLIMYNFQTAHSSIETRHLFVKPNEQRHSRKVLSDAMARKGRMQSNNPTEHRNDRLGGKHEAASYRKNKGLREHIALTLCCKMPLSRFLAYKNGRCKPLFRNIAPVLRQQACEPLLFLTTFHHQNSYSQ